MRCVAVTGTNGKTTTTRWVAAALRSLGPVLSVTTVGSFLDDEPWGPVPDHGELIRRVERAYAQGVRWLALETTSEALALGFAKAWPINVGVFTNLSHDHLDAHLTPEHYLASKAQLFVHLPSDGTAVLNADDEVHTLLQEVLPPGVSTRTYSRRGSADLVARDIDVGWHGTNATLQTGDADPLELHLPLIGDMYVENAMAALLAAHALGVDLATAARGIGTQPPVPGRFQVVTQAPYVVVDYAHTPDALERTLAVARRLCKGSLTIVFGAGGDRDKDKRPLMGRASAAADRIVLTSDNPRSESPQAIADAIAGGIAPGAEVWFEPDRVRAIEVALSRSSPDDVIVVAGKGHEVTQEIESRRVPMDDVAVVRRLRPG